MGRLIVKRGSGASFARLRGFCGMTAFRRKCAAVMRKQEPFGKAGRAGRGLAALGGKRFLNESRYVWSGVNRRDAPLAWLKGFCGKAALKRTRRLAYKREELCVFRQGNSLVGRSAFPVFPRRGVLLGRKRRHFGADVLRGARQSDMIEALSLIHI